MRLNAPQGQKVSYTEQRGDPWGGSDPQGVLALGGVYTVDETLVFRDSSYVRLAEFPGHEFNTVLFTEVGELLPPVDTVEEIYTRGLEERHGNIFDPYDDEEEEIVPYDDED